MSRSQPYRSRMPVEILKTLDVASRITLFMVAQTGPLSFTFKDRLDNKYKTSIGAQLKCSCCPNKNDHCIHTLYIMLKVFKVSTENPILWQAAYVDSQLSDLLAGKHTLAARRIIRPIFEEEPELPSDFLLNKQREKLYYSFPESKAERMKLNEESVCPICQESMVEDQCLSFCRVKCGNNFHTQCLKVWAQHKKTTQSSITCPMCRSSMGQNFLLQIDREQRQFKKAQSNKIQLKYKCSSCGVDNIPKNVHKCLLCTSFELCEVCFKANKHIKHPFIRQSEEDNSRWCGAGERRESELKMKEMMDIKRKQKNVNQQIVDKLRNIMEDPSKLLDFVASSYPYVSKYISDNIDPYTKLDFNAEDMKCMKCHSKKMLFLRRLTCGHFIDHECLKENIRKEKYYCDQCGNKIVKGYENLMMKEKELTEKKQSMFDVSSEFDPQRMQRKSQLDSYNFIGLNEEEPTLTEILGGRVRERESSRQDNERLRHRLASNVVRDTVETRAQQTQSTAMRARPPKNNSSLHRQKQAQLPEANNNIRIRSVARSTYNSVNKANKRESSRRKSRQDMGIMLEAMIGRKVF